MESEAVSVVEAEVVSCETGELADADESPTPTRAWESRLFGFMAKGLSLREACRQEGMPHFSTVYEHAAKDKGFAADLAEARKSCAHAQQDELDEFLAAALIEENPGKIQGLRLAADILKFKLVKVLPKLYGDSPTTVIDNRQQIVVLSDERRAELQDRLRRLQTGEHDNKESNNDQG